jgi:hypothetical protein
MSGPHAATPPTADVGAAASREGGPLLAAIQALVCAVEELNATGRAIVGELVKLQETIQDTAPGSARRPADDDQRGKVGR